MASFSSGWLVITGAGGGLPSASLVLRRGGAWDESSLILCYCYFLASPAPIRHVRGSHFILLVPYRPLGRLLRVRLLKLTQ